VHRADHDHIGLGHPSLPLFVGAVHRQCIHRLRDRWPSAERDRARRQQAATASRYPRAGDRLALGGNLLVLLGRADVELAPKRAVDAVDQHPSSFEPRFGLATDAQMHCECVHSNCCVVKVRSATAL
jgi:hypothetical protein